MKEENPENKYKKEGKIGQLLIKNFFNTIRVVTKAYSFNNVLELGCGPGESTRRLADILRYKKIRASDYDQNLIEKAKINNPNITITKEDIYNVERRDASFDLVICLEVLEHLEYPEKAIREIYRVSSRYALLSVPNEPLWRALNFLRGKYLSSWGNTPGHIQHWDPGGFKGFIAQYFEIIEVKTPLPWMVFFLKKK